MLQAVTDAVNIPVIASGGAGSADDFAPAVLEGGASAVLAASIFHFGEVSLAEARRALARAGAPVRAFQEARP
ncbi:MAG: HisA/HisF-related TIM barrel protein, partial [Pseudomonadota bacterium]